MSTVRNSAFRNRSKCLVAGMMSLVCLAGQNVAWGQNYAPNQAYSPNQVYSSGQAPAAQGLEPVFVKNRSFDIPVNVDSRGPNRPTELDLFVSRDSGQNWEFYSRERPESGRFAFSAQQDGEYWFAVRPGAGTANVGAKFLTPSLRIAVDTIEPRLDLQSSAEANGFVSVHFTVEDMAASTSGIQVYYRTDTPDASWLTLDQARFRWMKNEGSQFEGEISFDPQVDWRRISIHAVATDQAGNQTTVQRIVERPRVAGTQARLASAPQPGFAGATGFAGPANQLQATGDMGGQYAGRGSNGGSYSVVTPQPRQPQAALTGLPGTTGLGGTAPKYNELAFQAPASAATQNDYQERDLDRAATPPAVTPPGYRGMGTNLHAARPVTASSNGQQNFGGQNFGGQNFGGQNFGGQGIQPPLTAAQEPPAQSTSRPSNDPPPAPSSAFREITTENLPAPARYGSGANPLETNAIAGDQFRDADANYEMRATAVPVQQSPAAVNSNSLGGRDINSAAPFDREIQATSELPVDESELNYSRNADFELAYDFEAVGGRAIQKVELWGTRDGGKTWAYWGEDDDNVSPFDITVQGQGVYGFRMVAVDAQNLTSPTPQPGDAAEIYVLVDKTSPMVKLTSARYGEGADAGSLVIEYGYQDDHPISRPVSLSFSDSVSGPWTTIATGLENTGRFTWQVDARLPKNIYLRVEGTDRAGNTGVDTSTTPISLRGLAPTARIIGFQPTQSESARLPSSNRQR
jgi:hypothetical protein